MGGSRPLQDACRQANVAVEEVLRSIESAPSVESGAKTNRNFNMARLSELIAHVLATHHAYLKYEIPRLKQLLVKVVAVHGAAHAELPALQQIFNDLADEFTAHMTKEEMVLFPYIEKLEQATGAGKRAPVAPFGSIRNPVRMMEMEHESAGQALQGMRDLTSGYVPPEGACFSYKTLYSALKDFEVDLHQHVHLENNILFPRAIELEGRG